MSDSQPTAKFRPWHVKIGGTSKYISVLSTDTPDSLGGAGGGLNFRGEYNSASTYGVQDLVFIRAGSNAGAFICIQASPGATNPPTNPDVGNQFWMAFPGSFGLGQWM